MKPLSCLRIVLFLLLCAATRLTAQELSVLGGTTTSGVFQKSTYAWEVDYRQDVWKYLDASVAYINEGHFPGHLRDGTSYEAWFNLPVWDGRIAVSGGAGVYYYYDTQLLDGSSVDVHGTAPIVSLSVTGYLSDNWFYRVMLNRITPSADTKDTTVLVGLGYWFGPNRRPEGTNPNAGAPAPQYVTEPELTVYGGQTVVNTFYSDKAWAGSAEYRQGILPHVDATGTYIYEGNPQSERRNGVAAQLWLVNTFVDKDTSVGIGLGPYVFIDKRHPEHIVRYTTAAVAPLLSLTVARRLSENVIARFIWDRVTTAYNRDADIFLVGLGYTWR
jgi:hypothetical protein